MSNSTSQFPLASILGYPRIGPNRELKFALESFWHGENNDLAATADELRVKRTQRLRELGLEEAAAIPEDFSYYDQVLDIITALGAVPERFAAERKVLASAEPESTESLKAQFTIARGEGDRAALSLMKWLDSNYHYLVPEIGPDTEISYLGSKRVRAIATTKDVAQTRPVLVGPLTFLLLASAADNAPEGYEPFERLDDVLAGYKDLVEDLKANGATLVQFDEPALCSDRHSVARERILEGVAKVYGELAEILPTAVALSYGHAEDVVDELAKTKVDTVVLDLVRGCEPGEADLNRWAESYAGRTIALGIISGRNIWRTDLDEALESLRRIKKSLGDDVRVAVTTSTSLQHVPHDVSREEALDPQIRSWLAFADQKVEEVVALAKGLAEGDEAIEDALSASRAAATSRREHPGVKVEEVRKATAAVSDDDRNRGDYAERKAAQDEALKLPLLPTTTIGSFPQTKEIRAARAAHRRGELSTAEYEAAMEKEIHDVIRTQEEIGVDVLVHGEAERNDMVQYFAEHLNGFVTTTHGWVQSYGSRCTRPSILWGDVTRPEPITVRWSGYAASLTDRVVKGMLTGPVTIMAWSFVREDIPWGEVADQLGLCLRDEVRDLEAAGVQVIQVDEPAIRELLPLRSTEESEYLRWSVGSFRLATGSAAKETSIHTHLCYSDFATVVDAIDRLDADVTSIEASRSRMAVLPAIAEHGFNRGLGPGVWDIHSPRVPSVEEISELIDRALDALAPEQLWVNPDCGLKTRGWEETSASLKNLVEAAKAAREKLS